MLTLSEETIPVAIAKEEELAAQIDNCFIPPDSGEYYLSSDSFQF